MSDQPRSASLWTYLAPLLGNVVMLLIINLNPVWRPWTHGVVTDEFARVVWAANLSAVVQIAGNALLLLFRPPLLARLTRLAFSGASLLAAIVFYVRFPLDFSQVGVGWLDGVAHVLLLLGVIGGCLAVVADLLRLAFPRPGGPRPTPIGGSSGYG